MTRAVPQVAIVGRQGECRVPANFARAVFLRMAASIARRRAGRPGKEVSRALGATASAALEGDAALDLFASPPKGTGFDDPARRKALLAAMREIVSALEVPQEEAEAWNACPSWRQWGVGRARTLRAFLEKEAVETDASEIRESEDG